MNIVVAMKQIPDLTQVRIRDQRPVFDDAVYQFGDLDKNAMEAAVQLVEGGLDAEITLLSVGNEEVEETAKEGLAAGADKAYLLCDDEFDQMDASQTAEVLAAAIQEMGDVDLLVMGEGSGDEYSGQMVGRVAEVLGWPQLGFATSLKVDGGRVVIEQGLEDRYVTLSADLPAVVSVSADINEARTPAVTAILKAGKKPCEVLDASDADVDVRDESSIEILSSLAPENNRAGAVAGSMDELVGLIKSKNIL